MIEDKNPQKTELSDLGEFGLIEILTRSFKLCQSSSIKGVGDDAAVVWHGKNHTVVTTDLLVENVHFNLGYMPLKHLGYKAVIVNLSDVYAMNAKPTQITVSIAVSNRFSLEALEEIYAGIALACQKYEVDLVGGDTTSSLTGLIISITALGEAPNKDLVYRSGAKPNDLLVVSGDLGAAYLGYQILERENQVFKVNPNNQPDLEPYSYLIERQLKPEARRDIPELLKKLEVQPTSMIDISDGLSSEILHICKQSGVGAVVYENKIPIDPQVLTTSQEFGLNPMTAALNGGEDYELLFTVAPADYDKIKGNPHLSVIGYITDEAENAFLQNKNNERIALTAQGWNAFKK